jgi:hypothetical protein
MSAPVDQQLQHARDRLAALDRERAETRATIAELERQTGGPQTASAEERVAVFASLFRGHPDVFATRWESRTDPGRSGWAPRRDNEWRPGVCEKPRVKCAACAQRRFVVFCEAEVRRHLEGRQTIGIYPMLSDETCWLVAIDLDGASWREDSAALREAATEAAVPVLVESSRSGEGAHVWVLFSRPVAARVARSVASWLLTRAMSRRSIAMDSYDRLFPNQDTMPAGGSATSSRCRCSASAARMAARCSWMNRCSRIQIGGRTSPGCRDWTVIARSCWPTTPSERRDAVTRALGRWPDGRARATADVRADVGDTVTARLAGRLELDVAGLALGLVDRLRRTAAFANPMFFERERARLSTHKTPRVIACHEVCGGRLLLPRGCLDGVRNELDEAGVTLVIADDRVESDAIKARFVGRPGTRRRCARAA